SDIDGPAGEAGDLIERAHNVRGVHASEGDRAVYELCDALASALAAYQVKVESAERMYRSACSRADHAEAALTAATEDNKRLIEARDRASSILSQYDCGLGREDLSTIIVDARAALTFGDPVNE